jgi:hypothetical protein
MLEEKLAFYFLATSGLTKQRHFYEPTPKVKNALLGLMLVPFYIFEERERDKKLRDRLARLEEKKK